MRSKKLLYLLCSVFYFLIGASEVHPQSQLKITIIDSASIKPIELATVNIHDGTHKVVNSILTDSNGTAYFNLVSNNVYFLKISYLGYGDYFKEVNVQSDTSMTVYLHSEVKTLAEVIVRDKKTALKFKSDRIIYTINQPSEKGKYTSDVMRNIPFVVVTNDRVIIKGNSNYTILRNGNPSNLTIQDLRSLPISQVQSIELITSPSSKYDGQFQNIINVIMRSENDYAGGVAFTRLGTRTSSAGISYLKSNKRINTSVSGNVSYDQLKSGAYTQTSLFADTPFITRQDNTVKSKAPSFSSNYNSEITLSKRQYLSIGGKLGIQKNSVTGDYISQIAPYNSEIRSANRSRINSTAADFRLDYSNKLTSNSNLFISNLFRYTQGAFSLSSVNNGSLYLSSNHSNTKEYTSQVDYDYLYKKGVKAEIGAKVIVRNYRMSPIYNEVASNQFSFNQIVSSAYLTVSKSVKKISIRLGSRLEQTQNSYVEQNTSNLNLLPNVLVSYILKPAVTYNLFYRKNLIRPGFAYLSNFENRSYILNSVTGNPNLTSEIYNSCGIEGSYILGNSSLSFSASFGSANHLISSRRIVDSFSANTTFGNFAKSRSFDNYISFNSPIIDSKLYFNFSGSLKYYHIAGLDQFNEGFVKDFNVGFNYTLSKMSIDLYVNYLNNDILLQQSMGNSLYYDLSARYQLKRSSFLLQLNNPLAGKITQSTKGKGERFVYSGNSYIIGRAIAVAYAVSFGKTKDDNKKTKSVKNGDTLDDKKR